MKNNHRQKKAARQSALTKDTAWAISKAFLALNDA